MTAVYVDCRRCQALTLHDVDPVTEQLFCTDCDRDQFLVDQLIDRGY